MYGRGEGGRRERGGCSMRGGSSSGGKQRRRMTKYMYREKRQRIGSERHSISFHSLPGRA